MRSIKILVDMDDVLLDLLPHWVSKLNGINAAFGAEKEIKTEDIRSWNITTFFPMLTKEQVFMAIRQDGFWESISPTKDGQRFIKELQKFGNKICIVTASGYETLPSKMKRFFHLYPTLSWDDVIVTNQKQSVIGDALIDDAVHNLIGGTYEKILLNKPHNMEFDAASHSIHRIEKLEQAFPILRRIKPRA